MKRIVINLITYLALFSGIFVSGDVCADNEANASISLPKGVMLADEELGQNQLIEEFLPGKPLEDKEEDNSEQMPEDVRSEKALMPGSYGGTSSAVAEGPEERLLPKEGLAELRAYVDKSNITIGEKVTFTLEIDADNDLKVEFPSYVSGLGGFVVKDFGKEDKKIGRRRLRRTQWYLLDTYTTGSYVIPAQIVNITLANGQGRVLKSPQIFVEVKSVIDDSEEAGLRDIKPPFTVSAGPPFVLIISAISLILAAACVILGKAYIKRLAAKKTEIPLTAEEIALGELERIESLGFIEKMRIKEYYYLVSLALRQYLENRFSLKAPEQTTEEFLESVARTGSLEPRHINLLKEYLSHCDLVKYAKFDPEKSQASSLIETTRRFIKETKEFKETGGYGALNGART